jgi:hypothetical protein
MDLGLEGLTDEQLFELIRQVCGELSRRDPVVRRCAQAEIYTQAEKLKVAKESLAEAVETAREECRANIRAELLAEARKAVQTGEIPLLSAESEAKLIPETTLAAKLQLIDESLTALRLKSGSRFSCEIVGDIASVTLGKQTVRARHNLNEDQLRLIGTELRLLVCNG